MEEKISEQVGVESHIYEIRGTRVMLDYELAEMYQVETKTLKQAVRRNIERFPEDFMFELTKEEVNSLIFSSRSQFVTLNARGLNIKYNPFAFTQEGIAMLSGILRSPIAVLVNIRIMRAFVAARNLVTLIPSENHYKLPASQADFEDLKADMENLQTNFNELRQDLEEIFADYNDINEDTRHQIDLISNTLAELSAKQQIYEETKRKTQRKKIGF